MNIARRFISTFVIFLSLASVVNALPYIDPGSHNSSGWFLGVDDGYTGGHNGSIVSRSIFDIWDTYGERLLINLDANRESPSNLILQLLEIDQLQQDYSKLNNFFFFVNGHGYYDESDRSSVSIKIGSDYNGNLYLTDDDLAYYMSTIPSHVNKWVIIDSCLSGGFIDELKALENISIITSSRSFTSSAYSKYYESSYFGMELVRFFEEQAGNGFSFQDLRNHLIFNRNINYYVGMISLNLGSEEEYLFTIDDWDVQVYQSPQYAPVPEPSTFLLLGGGLAGLVFVARRKRRE